MTTVTSAWQAALAAEHQACFAYGLLGPRLDGTQRQLAYDCVLAHSALRDATAAALSAASFVPVPPAADYPSLYPVRDASSARRLAARVEDDCAAAWRYLYAQAAAATGSRATSLRNAAQSGLTSGAVRAARWRRLIDPSSATEPFPGI